MVEITLPNWVICENCGETPTIQNVRGKIWLHCTNLECTELYKLEFLNE